MPYPQKCSPPGYACICLPPRSFRPSRRPRVRPRKVHSLRPVPVELHVAARRRPAARQHGLPGGGGRAALDRELRRWRKRPTPRRAPVHSVPAVVRIGDCAGRWAAVDKPFGVGRDLSGSPDGMVFITTPRGERLGAFYPPEVLLNAASGENLTPRCARELS
jgi:hypothetical protein